MDWQAALQDAGLIAGVSTAIFMVIEFIKRIYYKLPWRWVQKTPGEVWLGLSIAFGLIIALVVLWPVLTSGEGTLFDKASAAIYGAVFGAGSKLINFLSSAGRNKFGLGKKEESPVIPPVETPLGTVETPTFPEEVVIETKTSNAEIVKKIPSKGDYVIIDGNVYKLMKEEQ